MPTTGQVRFEKYKKEEQFKFIRNSATLYPAHLKQNIFKCSAQIQLRKKLMIKCKKLIKIQGTGLNQYKGEDLNTVD